MVVDVSFSAAFTASDICCLREISSKARGFWHVTGSLETPTPIN